MRPLARLGGHAGRALLDGQHLSRDALDRLQTRSLAVIAERNGDPGRARPARSADAMDIAVGIDPQIEVHHVRDIVDLQPAGGDGGGHQQRLRRIKRATPLSRD